jgi:putative transposase
MRQECLDLHLFESVKQVQNLTTQWLWIYSNQQPHFALGGLPSRKRAA